MGRVGTFIKLLFLWQAFSANLAVAEVNHWGQVRDYWAPKIDATYEMVVEYWKPRIDKTLRESAIAFDDYFHEKVHPAVKNVYQAYYKLWGKEVGDLTLRSLRFVASTSHKLGENSYDYLSEKYPNEMEDIGRVPTPIKKGYEQFVYSVWRGLNSTDEAIERLPAQYKETSEFAVLVINAIKNAKDHPNTPRIEALLERLRPYVADPEMKDCYKVQIVEMGFNNAFNTGCNIFVTDKMMDNLTDEDLLAVLAHEISHGDYGHSTASFMSLIGSGGSHVVQLFMDQMYWLFTGEKTYRLATVLDQGNMPLILEAFGSKAPKQEEEADHYGACILQRAGLPEEWMQAALLKLHKVTLEEYQKNIEAHDKDVTSSVRQYPSLKRRMEASRCD